MAARASVRRRSRRAARCASRATTAPIPDYRTEWWYVTGWLQHAGRQAARLPGHVLPQPHRHDRANPSAFAPQAADHRPRRAVRPGLGHLLHDQRSARAGFGLAYAQHRQHRRQAGRLDACGATPDGRYRVAVRARRARLRPAPDADPAAAAAGRGRLFAKGPAARPRQLLLQRAAAAGRRHSRARGAAGRRGHGHAPGSTTNGPARCSTPSAAGWDWVGANLDDGARPDGLPDPRQGRRQALGARDAARRAPAT